MKLSIWCALNLSLAAALAIPLAAQQPSSHLTTPTLVRLGDAPAWDFTEPFPADEGRNRLVGGLWGGGIGLVAGGILGGLSVESDADDGGFGGLTEASATGEAVVLGAFVGATIGALLGATVFAPAPRQGAPSSNLSATPMASGGAYGLVVRIAR